MNNIKVFNATDKLQAKIDEWLNSDPSINIISVNIAKSKWGTTTVVLYNNQLLKL